MKQLSCTSYKSGTNKDCCYFSNNIMDTHKKCSEKEISSDKLDFFQEYRVIATDSYKKIFDPCIRKGQSLYLLKACIAPNLTKCCISLFVYDSFCSLITLAQAKIENVLVYTQSFCS